MIRNDHAYETPRHRAMLLGSLWNHALTFAEMTWYPLLQILLHGKSHSRCKNGAEFTDNVPRDCDEIPQIVKITRKNRHGNRHSLWRKWRNDKKTPFHSNENRPVFPGDSSHCVTLHSTTVAGGGFEQPSKTSRKSHTTPPPNTESNTVDRDLQSVIDAWANLPGHVRRAIAVLVNASKPGVTG